MSDFMDLIDDKAQAPHSGARILVVGVGGGGGNAVKNMIERGLKGVEFICANTDLQALNENPAPTHIQLGEKLTRGLGAGSDPNKGREAATESLQLIEAAVGNADMVFVTAGMGGGTGTGAAPIVAETARKNGALTVGVVTRPFTFEGARRASYAQNGIDELRKHVDSLIIIPNNRIMSLAPKKSSMLELLAMANDVLFFGVKGISDIITCPGYVNLDFADVRTCMFESGLALMGMGMGSGDTRAEDAVNQAITMPLLEDVSLKTAKAVLYNITAPSDISAEEMQSIGDRIYEAVPEGANIVFGVVFDDTLEDQLRVTVVATGIETDGVLDAGAKKPQAKPQAQVNAAQGAAQAAEKQPAEQQAGKDVLPPFLKASSPSPRRAFQREAQERWKQEKGALPSEQAGDDASSDILEIPAFLRRHID